MGRYFCRTILCGNLDDFIIADDTPERDNLLLSQRACRDPYLLTIYPSNMTTVSCILVNRKLADGDPLLCSAQCQVLSITSTYVTLMVYI